MGTEVAETFGLCGFFCSNIEIRSVRAFLAAGELMMFDFFSRVWCQISLRSLISSSFVAVRQFLNCMYKLTLKSSSYSCYHYSNSMSNSLDYQLRGRRKFDIRIPISREKNKFYSEDTTQNVSNASSTSRWWAPTVELLDRWTKHTSEGRDWLWLF